MIVITAPKWLKKGLIIRKKFMIIMVLVKNIKLFILIMCERVN